MIKGNQFICNKGGGGFYVIKRKSIKFPHKKVCTLLEESQSAMETKMVALATTKLNALLSIDKTTALFRHQTCGGWRGGGGISPYTPGRNI